MLLNAHILIHPLTYSFISQVKKVTRTVQAPDSSRHYVGSDEARRWADAKLIESLRDLFVTGTWDESEDAAKVGVWEKGMENGNGI